MLDFIYMGSAGQFGTWREQTIQNENMFPVGFDCMIECQWSQQKNICKSKMGQDQVTVGVNVPGRHDTRRKYSIETSLNLVKRSRLVIWSRNQHSNIFNRLTITISAFTIVLYQSGAFILNRMIILSFIIDGRRHMQWCMCT